MISPLLFFVHFHSLEGFNTDLVDYLLIGNAELIFGLWVLVRIKGLKLAILK